MLLAIDVGNTHIVIGVMEGLELQTSFRLTTQTPRTSDEFGMALFSLLRERDYPKDCIESVIISSVVPTVMHALQNAIKRYLNITPLIVGPGLKTGIPIKCDNPKEVGADRIVNCVAGHELYGSPCLVIDFGTATTYDVLDDEGTFIAGITSPGIGICADALWSNTAQLPHIEIKKTKNILDAKNTVTSMQTGLVYGYIGQVEYIVTKVKEALGRPNMHVVATGGLSQVIKDGTDVIDHYDSLLTLKGLALLYAKNR